MEEGTEIQFTWKRQTSVKKLETSGCCFLCLNVLKFKKGPSKVKFENSVSLRCLRRYLKINLERLKLPEASTDEQFISNDGNGRKQSLEGRGGGEEEIAVDLCESCDELVSRFSNKFEQLEIFQMEVSSCLEGIHQRISKTTKNLDLVQNYLRKMKRVVDVNDDDEVLTQEQQFVDNLRKEITRKSKKILCSGNGSLSFPYSAHLTIPIEKVKKRKKSESLNDAEDHLSEPEDFGMAAMAMASSPITSSSSSPFPSSDLFNFNQNQSAIIKKECFTDKEDESQFLEDMDGAYDDDQQLLFANSPSGSILSTAEPESESDVAWEAKPSKRNSGRNRKSLRRRNSSQKSSSSSYPAPAHKKKEMPYIKNPETGTFDCKVCHKPHKQRTNAKRHYQRDHLQERHICPKCEAPYRGKWDMEKHLKKCDGNGIKRANQFTINNPKMPIITRTAKAKKHKKYNCKVCTLESPSYPEGMEHYREEHVQKQNFPCPSCEGLNLPTLLEWKAHRKEVHNNEGMYTCEICGNKIKTIHHLRRHLEEVHERKRHHCEICNIAEFCNVGAFRDHQKFCKETLEQRLIEKAEKEMKLSESNFECEICGKKFLSKNSIQRHVKSVHLDERNFPCDEVECGKRFRNQQQLNEHKDCVHSGTLYYCKFCLKPSQSPHLCKVHEKKCGREMEMKAAAEEKTN